MGTRDFGNFQKCTRFTRFFSKKKLEWSDLPAGYRFKCDHEDDVHLGLQSLREDRDWDRKVWQDGKFNVECRYGHLGSHFHQLGDAAKPCEDRVLWVKADGN